MTLVPFTARAFPRDLPRLRAPVREPAPESFSQASAWPAEDLARFAELKAAYERLAALYARPWATKAIRERAPSAAFEVSAAADRVWEGLK